MARHSAYVNSSVPVIKHSRSRFDLSKSHLTSINVGDLVPIYAEEVYPGDTFVIKETHISRVTSAFLKPVMDNAFVDVRFFYVPYRLLMPEGEWEQFWGYQDQPWIQSQPAYDTELPTVALPSSYGSSYVGTLADYFGDLPWLHNANVSGSYVSDGAYSKPGYTVTVKQMPYRAYAKVVNDWYRSEVTDNAVNVFPSGSQILNDNPWGPQNIFGMPFVVDKLHDYFTNATPSPQLGSQVTLPLTGNAPVTVDNWTNWQAINNSAASQAQSLTMYRLIGGQPAQGGLPLVLNQHGDIATDDSGNVSGTYHNVGVKITGSGTATGIADLSGVTAASVNDLRFAFQLQKLLERNIYGVRYTEYLMSHFGVSAGDSRLQRSEYLGGTRNPISIQQVANQTDSQQVNSPALGTLGAYSLSSGRARCAKSFVEHGIILGLACIRQYHTYSQGIPRWHFRTTRNQFYDPLWANLGNQPIYQKELYIGQNVTDDSVFGYNEAFADMRQGLNMVSGAMRPGLAGLDIWHFADDYASAPVLNQSFLRETSVYMDRTIAVQPSPTEPAFIFDFYFDVKATRPLPVYSLPGLIDHH